ncbi:MAG: HDIG domain-containing metalloprotein, partial [bacterium]
MGPSEEGPSYFVALWRKVITNPATPRVAVALASFFLILGVTASHLASPRSSILEVGNVARTDYVAPYFALFEDTTATLSARDSAAGQVDFIYTIDNAIPAGVTDGLVKFFNTVNELSLKLANPGPNPDVENMSDRDTAPETIEEDPQAAAIQELSDLLDEAAKTHNVHISPVEDKDLLTLLKTNQAGRDVLFNVIDRSLRARMISIVKADDLPKVLDSLRETITENSKAAKLSSDSERIATGIALHFMRPNAVVDLEATEKAKKAARNAIEPVMSQVRAGEIFLRAGEVITKEDIDILNALGMMEQTGKRKTWIGIFLFTVLLACSFILASYFLRSLILKNLDDLRHYILFYTILTLAYLTCFFLIQRIYMSAQGMPSAMALTLASLPVIAAAVLFAHYFTRLLASVASGLLAIFVTIAANEPAVLLPALFTSIAASLLIRRDCPRPTMIKAIVVLPLLWSVALLAQAYSAGIDLSVLTANPWIILAGIAPAPVAMIMADFLLDSAFNIPTTNRLREFDSPDHPLLRKLQLEAPGTWHHSMMLGLIAEAACQAVGGNTLLVRVACMYHDIGKIRRPEFFIENQGGGRNLHDKYSPWLSKIIVEGHVKDGIAMAKAHGLPKELIDMIPQHHGTALIQYFFRKALAMSEDGYVNEYEYRYPGPKPQSPEAACINIADASESATRSLEDPTPHRIETQIKRIYEERLLDGQYDECGLALNQLDLIKTVIIGRLTAAYHGRIEYPEEEELRRQLQLKRA